MIELIKENKVLTLEAIMANFFKSQNNASPVSERALLESRISTSRANLLLVVVFTLVNSVLLLTGSTSYFLFSAFIPYFFVSMGMYYTGKLPVEFYEDYESLEFFPSTFLWVAVAVAAVILVVYLLCWIFSKKKPAGWLIAALVFFVIDTLILFGNMESPADSIIDIVFHVWVLFSLGRGIASCFKLKKLPPEENIVLDASEAVEVKAETEN